jgi:N12 class adenine-specific DNA methylase
VKGLAARASQRATDLFLKVRHLDERRPGRSAVFATGTPVSNSIAEMYTMQRYLQLGALGSYGIAEFDAWAATFGDIVTQAELAPSGKGFRTVRSFSKFVNIPELIALYSCVADTQTAEMLKLPCPTLRTGMVQVVEAEMSERESAYMAALVTRADAIKGKRPDKGGDNMLKIMSEGLQLATDIRLIDPDAPVNPTARSPRRSTTSPGSGATARSRAWRRSCSSIWASPARRRRTGAPRRARRRSRTAMRS